MLFCIFNLIIFASAGTTHDTNTHTEMKIKGNTLTRAISVKMADVTLAEGCPRAAGAERCSCPSGDTKAALGIELLKPSLPLPTIPILQHYKALPLKTHFCQDDFTCPGGICQQNSAHPRDAHGTPLADVAFTSRNPESPLVCKAVISHRVPGRRSLAQSSAG